MDETAAIVYTAPVEPSEVDDLASTFEAFVDAEAARFHGALRLLVRDRAEAEDLMQDATSRSGSAGTTCARSRTRPAISTAPR
jgi:DNA-directed RNA polymerase specialized sigma24 family protein